MMEIAAIEIIIRLDFILWFQLMFAMRTYIPLLLLTTLVFCACVDDETEFLNRDLPGPSKVNLFDLKPGQSSLYIAYEQDCDSTNFRWTGDTLVTGIFDIDGQLYMSEQLTSGSPSYPGDKKGISYPISSQNGILTLPERELSKLFGFYGNDEIYLLTNERINLNQSGCLLATDDDIFTGAEIGYIRNFVFGEIAVGDKSVVGQARISDIDAYLIYDQYQLHVSHQVFSNTFQGVPLDGVVKGWVLID